MKESTAVWGRWGSLLDMCYLYHDCHIVCTESRPPLTTSLAFSSQRFMSGPVRRAGLIMEKTPQAIGPARSGWIQRDGRNSVLNLWARRVRPIPVDPDISSGSRLPGEASVDALTISSQINRRPGGEQAPLLGVTLDPLLLAGAFIHPQMREGRSSGLSRHRAGTPLSWSLWSLGEFHGAPAQAQRDFHVNIHMQVQITKWWSHPIQELEWAKSPEALIC